MVKMNRATRRYLVLLWVWAVERGVELAVSRRNSRQARLGGAVESGRRHSALVILLHTLFLPACAAEALRRRPDRLRRVPLGFALLAQGLRWWAVATLGRRWSVRVITWPGLAPVETGPYRWLRHPNYLAVVVEVAALPLCAGGHTTATLFTVANGLLLRRRIGIEEGALGPAYTRRLGDRPCLLPRLSRLPRDSLASGARRVQRD
jgi:methyltransferase